MMNMHEHSCLLQAGLGPAAAAIFLQPGEFGENLETSTLQNPVTDVTDAPEAFTTQYLSEVRLLLKKTQGHTTPLSLLYREACNPS